MSEVKLEEVLEEYAVATPAGNNLKVLRDTAENHPEFAGELADFAAARAVARHAPEEELTVEEETRARESAVTNFRLLLDSPAFSSTPALESLTEAAKKQGLNRSKFAAALGLSVSLVQYLEKRRLDFATIPKAVIKKIAGALQMGEETISGYLNRPPDLLTNASFKTADRPGELKPKTFAEAVREDQTLTSAEKNKLLEL